MSTIGVGKAFRDVDRAARQARERRDGFQRATGSSELPELRGTVACAGCGVEVAQGDVMFGDQGGLCPTCFGEAESRAATALVPSRGSRALVTSARVALLWSVAGFFGWIVARGGMDVASSAVSWGAPKALLGWTLLVGCVTLLAAVSSLQSLKDLQIATAPSLEDGTRDGTAIATAGASALATWAPTAVLAGLTLLPWLLLG